MSSTFASNRRQWKRIFGAQSNILQSQQRQIESLAEDRKFLHKYICVQHDHWSSQTRFLESVILQFRNEDAISKKLNATKLVLVGESTERATLLYKALYELSESDLDDSQAFLVALSTKNLELKHKAQKLQASVEEKNVTIMNLKSKHEADIKMHAQEVGHANMKIKQLELAKEGLELSISEKNDIIARLSGGKSKLVMDFGTSSARNSCIPEEQNSKKADIAGEPEQWLSNQGAAHHSQESAQCLSKQGTVPHSQERRNMRAHGKPVAYKSTGGKAPRRKNLIKESENDIEVQKMLSCSKRQHVGSSSHSSSPSLPPLPNLFSTASTTLPVLTSSSIPP